MKATLTDAEKKTDDESVDDARLPIVMEDKLRLIVFPPPSWICCGPSVLRHFGKQLSRRQPVSTNVIAAMFTTNPLRRIGQKPMFICIFPTSGSAIMQVWFCS